MLMINNIFIICSYTSYYSHLIYTPAIMTIPSYINLIFMFLNVFYKI